MGRYIVRRLSLGLLSLWALASLCFFLLRYLPGGPFLSDEQLHPLVRAQLEKTIGLADPWPVQYLRYLSSLFRFDFGVSYQNPTLPVQDLLAQAFLPTLQLALGSFLVCVVGLVFCAYFWSRSRRAAAWGGVISLFGFALPGLVLAPLLVDLFSLRLKWLPVARVESSWGYILPILAVSLRPTLRLGQVLAAEIRRLLQTDVARFARAQGFSDNKIFFQCIFPEAFLAVMAQLGTLFAHLMGGSLFIEVVFSIPGWGSLFADALAARDYPVVMGIVIWTGACTFFFQWIVDVAFVWLDPRLSLQREILE